MTQGLYDPRLVEVAGKLATGRRLEREDGLTLFETDDLLGLGRLADHANRLKNDDRVYYINNLHINYTNVCVNNCTFCAYRRQEDQDGAFFMPVDQILAKAGHLWHDKAVEFHIVGGCHPSARLDYYREMLSSLADAYPRAHLQAFTAVEIDNIARVEGTGVGEVLSALRESGLGSMPGGGGEIFAPRVRERICPEKISGERYLEVMREAHLLGIPTNVTMLFGHIEAVEDRVDHLLAIRGLQDETGGFNSFIPLLFHPWNTRLEELSKAGGIDTIKTIAISRLLLDNIKHIKAFWIMLGIALTQMSLFFGADDVNGTVLEEKITHEAGADTPQHMPAEKLEQLIRDAGRTPVERDTLYNPVQS
ncbi:MAG: aminofutalosine synthase MqnE [Candidatus Glassbacteria bacterium]|nr:aminofutalosine synthase MqnE [Candidatus Glassbacteria bacterium]